ncbi:MAG TPA: CsbD family protein [Acidimicrobiales bacterium]|nr:CsbD family protein [Acidimicrobiales bacterium]
MANYDELKGRTKEAAGDLTDDEDLQREGKVDQAQGSIKDKVERLGDRVKDAIRRD